MPQQTLRDEIRPLQGGIQIQRVSGSGAATCTLGLAARWNDADVFLTAGHCSPNVTGPDGVEQFQPAAPLTAGDSAATTAIGREVAHHSEPCGNRRCSFSDAAIYAIIADTVPPIPSEHLAVGRVARPASGCFPGPCNPPVLTLGPSPYWVFDTTHQSFLVNDLVSKIGSATGWSQGSVTKSCVNVSPVAGVTYECQMYANYGQGDGDSGAPILLDIMGGADSTVTLGGIHSGRAGNNSVFSPWSGIVQDYGVLSVTAEQRPRVPLTAPDTVPAWVYASENLASDTGASYQYYADVIIVRFTPDATQADRQAAIDAVAGEVVGGQAMPTGEGFYYVRLNAGRRLQPLAAAVQALWARPRVGAASLVTPLEEQYRRPEDQGDFASWEVRPDSAAGHNWGLEEVAGPLAWGCTVGSDSGPAIAIVGAVAPSRRSPCRSRHPAVRPARSNAPDSGPSTRRGTACSCLPSAPAP